MQVASTIPDTLAAMTSRTNPELTLGSAEPDTLPG
jgi:hypothetical protein